jgi:hypothetical protein
MQGIADFSVTDSLVFLHLFVAITLLKGKNHEGSRNGSGHARQNQIPGVRELDGSAMIMRVKFKTIQIIVFSTGAAVGDNQIDPKRVLRWRRRNAKTSNSGSCLSGGTDLL